jgi:zinc transport system permease protein
MLLLIIIIFILVIIFYKDLQILTFDEEFAKISGINIHLLNILLLILVAITIVIIIKVVGVVLAIAMLTIPAAISGFYSNNLKNMMIISIIIGIITTFLGSIISIFYDLPPGSTIVLVMALVFVLMIVIKQSIIKKINMKI